MEGSVTDTARQEAEEAVQEGHEQAAEASAETAEAVEEAAEEAAGSAEEAVEEAAETIAEAAEEAAEAVEEAAEEAAAATTGTDPALDVDAIADRVWDKIEGRLGAALRPAEAAAEEIVHGAEELGDVVQEAAAPVLEPASEIVQDLTHPDPEHWWFRERSLRSLGRRKRSS